MNERARKVLEELKRKKTEPEKVSKASDFLSCGFTLGNLGTSGYAEGAFQKGGYYHLVGTSDSGKSYCSMATFAEASINPRFKGYRLIHDDPEKGALMDLVDCFGRAMADRIEPPAGTKDQPKSSRSIQEFYYNLDDAISKGPCLYIVDSMDALFAEQDLKKFKKQKSAARKETTDEEKGSYGMAKAKANAEGMRIAYDKLQASGSILIVIGQAKVDMSFGAPMGSMTFAGGSSLKFYCQAQLWTKAVGSITKVVGSKSKQQGINVSVEIKKNRHTGRKVKVKFPLYWGTGIDDTGSMVDWLVEEGRWKEDGGKIKAKELEMVLPREELIQAIEKEDAEPEVRKIVVSHWQTIKEALIPQRKSKYNQSEGE